MLLSSPAEPAGDQPRWPASTAFRITLLHRVLALLNTPVLSGAA
jgi:hypothetical protein